VVAMEVFLIKVLLEFLVGFIGMELYCSKIGHLGPALETGSGTYRIGSMIRDVI